MHSAALLTLNTPVEVEAPVAGVVAIPAPGEARGEQGAPAREAGAKGRASRYDRFMWNRSRRLINPFSIQVLIGIALGLLIVLVFVLFGHPSTAV